MADENDTADRTEDPTQRRLDEAFARGDVPASPEVNTWFILAGGALMLSAFSGSLGSSLKLTLGGLLANAHQIAADGPGLAHFLERLLTETLAALGIPLLILVLAAVAGGVIQHRLVWSGEVLKPKLSKISPAAGFQRLFSKQALMTLVKGLLKLAVIGGVMTALLWPRRSRLEGLAATDPASLLSFTQWQTMDLLGGVVAVMAVIAAADYLFQYRQWFNRHKMSLREMKEEFRQTEGDPVVKGKLRMLRQTRMKKRMMAAVPKASVVITNPTHYAVALQYERGMNAPVCVAKGIDAIAKKIREVAEKHEIPVIENPPLARALHATVEVDQEVPPEHYKAVAEVIGYLMRLRRVAR